MARPRDRTGAALKLHQQYSLVLALELGERQGDVLLFAADAGRQLGIRQTWTCEIGDVKVTAGPIRHAVFYKVGHHAATTPRSRSTAWTGWRTEGQHYSGRREGA